MYYECINVSPKITYLHFEIISTLLPVHRLCGLQHLWTSKGDSLDRIGWEANIILCSNESEKMQFSYLLLISFNHSFFFTFRNNDIALHIDDSCSRILEINGFIVHFPFLSEHV